MGDLARGCMETEKKKAVALCVRFPRLFFRMYWKIERLWTVYSLFKDEYNQVFTRTGTPKHVAMLPCLSVNSFPGPSGLLFLGVCAVCARNGTCDKLGQRYSCETKIEKKMAEFYRCAVGPQLHRIFTRNSRQVGVGIVHFVKIGYSFNSSSINGRGAVNMKLPPAPRFSVLFTWIQTSFAFHCSNRALFIAGEFILISHMLYFRVEHTRPMDWSNVVRVFYAR